MDLYAGFADRDDFTDLAPAHRSEGRRRNLARVEQVDLALAHGCPGARSRVAASDQVVDEIDMGSPADPRLRVAHPALIGGPALILCGFGRPPRGDENGGLNQRLDAERED